MKCQLRLLEDWDKKCEDNELKREFCSCEAIYSESYCRKTDECGSVIPEGPGSGDSAPNCVLDGGTDQVDTPSGVINLVYSNGEYPACDYHNKISTEESSLNCCNGLVVKDDL